MRTKHWALAMIVAGLLTTPATGQTTVPLNTGYNHAVFAPYPLSQVTDSYWINIATYPPTTPAVGPAWVVAPPHPLWAPALAGSRWINGRNTFATAPGVTPINPGYTIFRKCFCLLPGFTDAKLSLTVRADDSVQIWMNTQLSVVLPASSGNLNSTPLSSLPSDPRWFREGINCIYALVEDQGFSGMGLNLSGTIQANGLDPFPAVGAEQTFRCPCARVATGAAGVADIDDADVISALIEIAEARRHANLELPKLQVKH